MLEVIILTRMRMYIAELVAKNAQLSGFIFCLSLGLPHFFVCADESDIWSTYVSNSFDDFVPEDVVHVFHLFNHIAYARRYHLNMHVYYVLQLTCTSI